MQPEQNYSPTVSGKGAPDRSYYTATNWKVTGELSFVKKAPDSGELKMLRSMKGKCSILHIRFTKLSQNIDCTIVRV